MKPRVTLSYDAAAGTDGTGAQLQRIFGIYAASKMLHVPYLHSNIQNLTITALDPFQDEASLRSYLDRVNKEFELPSSASEEHTFDEVRSVRNLNFRAFLLFYIKALVVNKSYLLLVQNPFQLVERFPRNFLHVQKYFSAISSESVTQSESKGIVFHIRRGSNGADLLPGEASPRMLANAYFFSLINEIRTKYCTSKEAIELIIITDAPKENFIYTPITEQLPLWSTEPRFRDGSIEMIGETFSDFDLDFLAGFKVIHGGDPIIAIQLMRDADFLVMSRSSFSFVGAILNSKGKVFYPPNFWHRPLPGWIRVA